MQSKNISRKDFLITLILALVGIFPGGVAGLHRIYCGKFKSGCVLAILNLFPFIMLQEVLRKIINYCLVYFINSWYIDFFEIFKIAKEIFLENKGDFLVYCYISIVIFLVLDVVLLCLGKFEDFEGKVVFKTKIFANIKRNIKNRKQFGGNL